MRKVRAIFSPPMLGFSTPGEMPLYQDGVYTTSRHRYFDFAMSYFRGAGGA